MAERRLPCVLVGTCDIRTANSEVSICLYIFLTYIYIYIYIYHSKQFTIINYQAASHIYIYILVI